MVSGWDKSPGPDNDYTPKPWSYVKSAIFAAMLALIFLAVGYLL